MKDQIRGVKFAILLAVYIYADLNRYYFISGLAVLEIVASAISSLIEAHKKEKK